MLGIRRSNSLPVLFGAMCLAAPIAAPAFQQVPPLSDEISTRPIHAPEAWAQRGFTSPGAINHSPADFGPAIGMSARTPDGNPASSDQFPVMQPGQLPGGFDRNGFNSSGMIPPVNQPDRIANNPVFGGGNRNQAAGQFSQQFGPIGNAAGPIGPNGQSISPNGQAFGPGANSFGPNSSQGNAPNRGPSDPRFGGAAGFGGSGTTGQFGQGPYGSGPMPPRYQKPRIQNAGVASRATVVGLLGQVARPGSYELTSTPMTLAQLIQQVGGTARDASGQLRVIRNGRPGQALNFSGAEQFELLPGDLVIAESKVGTSQFASNSETASETETNPSSTASRPSGVQVGFVNLLDRPVVLKLRNEHASVAAILNIMQQDSALAGKIQVILPVSHRFTGRVHPNMPLPSESVLIFPPNSVASDRLAGLPAPTKLSELNGTAGADSGQSLPSPGENQQSPNGQSSNGGIRLPGAESSTGELPAPPNEPSASINGGLDTNPRLPNSAVGAGHEAAEASDAAQAPPLPSFDSNEPTRFNTPGQQRPIKTSKGAEDSSLDLLDASEEPAANPTGWWTSAPIVIIALSLGGLLGLSLWLRRRTIAEREPLALPQNRRRALRTAPATPDRPVTARPIVAGESGTQTESRRTAAIESVESMRSEEDIPVLAAAPERPATTKRELLEALIQNQVPIATEHVSFASPMQFHGRPNAPQLVRVDTSHEVPKPHVSAKAGNAEDLDVVMIDDIRLSVPRERTTGTGPAVMPSGIRMDRGPQRSSGGSPLVRALSSVRSREARQ